MILLSAAAICIGRVARRAISLLEEDHVRPALGVYWPCTPNANHPGGGRTWGRPEQIGDLDGWCELRVFNASGYSGRQIFSAWLRQNLRWRDVRTRTQAQAQQKQHPLGPSAAQQVKLSEPATRRIVCALNPGLRAEATSHFTQANDRALACRNILASNVMRLA